MGETKDQIEHDIERTRARLGSNIQELEDRVKSVTDWRRQFERRPMALLGVAFGGGVMLGMLFGGGSRED